VKSSINPAISSASPHGTCPALRCLLPLTEEVTNAHPESILIFTTLNGGTHEESIGRRSERTYGTRRRERSNGIDRIRGRGRGTQGADEFGEDDDEEEEPFDSMDLDDEEEEPAELMGLDEEDEEEEEAEEGPQSLRQRIPGLRLAQGLKAKRRARLIAVAALRARRRGRLLALALVRRRRRGRLLALAALRARRRTRLIAVAALRARKRARALTIAAVRARRRIRSLKRAAVGARVRTAA